MTATLSVRIGAENHAIDLDSLVPVWSPGNSYPDVWVATRAFGTSGYGIEVEVSNGSANIGGKGRPLVAGAEVTLTPPAGYELLDPYGLPFPRQYGVQRGTFRRFGVAKLGIPSSEKRRINEYVLGKLRSNWDRSAFGPADLPLPTLSQAQKDSWAVRDMDAFWACLTAAKNGTLFHYEDTEDGICNPPIPDVGCFGGSKDRAAPAGSRIQFARGYQQTEGAARLFLLFAMLDVIRCRVQYRRGSGAPFTASDYGANVPDYKPASGSTNDRLPEFDGLTNPDPTPEEFDPAHRIRQDGNLIAAYEMTGSAACARLIVMNGEEQRLIYPENGPLPAYGYTPVNFRNALNWATAHVGVGYPGSLWGRQVSWSAWVAAEALKIDPSRTALANWLRVYCDISALVAMPSGVCQRNHDNSGLWNDATHDSAQAFEVGIQKLAEYAANRRIGRAIPSSIVQAARSLYDQTPQPGGGPWHFTYPAPAGGAPYPPPLALGKSADPTQAPGDPAHAEALLALAYFVTGDVHFLERSAVYGLGAAFPTWQAKRDDLLKRSELGWTATLLSMYQRVSV